MRNPEYIIVGQGLAGTLLSFELFKQGKSFIVMDENIPVTSSKVAPGMFTPISGKRMTKAANADEQISIAKQTYRELEKLLDIELLHEASIYNVLGSVKEQNDITLKRENENFFQHINLHPAEIKNIRQPFGAFEISGSGWLNIPLLLENYRKWLLQNDCFIEEKFDHAALDISEKITYKNISADKIIFCEGWRGSQNPLFKSLPFNLCKGEVLTIECKGLAKDHIIKKGVFIVHVHDDIFKVGSSYTWNDIDEIPTSPVKQQLCEKFEQLVDLPYTIIEHKAGIRPTTITREPFFIQHHKNKNMFMLNGLGTKGVMTGPWWVKEVMKSLL